VFQWGIGCVTNVIDVWDENEETGYSSPKTVVDVHYLVCNTREKNIELTRVTVIPMPYRGDRPTLRRAASLPKETLAEVGIVLVPDYELLTPIGESITAYYDTVFCFGPHHYSYLEGWLKYGLKTRRHETRGWLKKLLITHKLLEAGTAAVRSRVMADYQCQLVAIEMMKFIQGDKYKDPRLVSEHGVFHGKHDGRFHTKKAGVPTGVFTIPYLIHAYDVSESSFKRK
jgi:hypothetical protein